MAGKFKTLRFDMSEIEMLLDAMDRMYHSGEYAADSEHNINRLRDRLRTNYGAMMFDAREAAAKL